MSKEYEPCRILDEDDLNKPLLEWRTNTAETRIQKLFNSTAEKREFPGAFQRHKAEPNRVFPFKMVKKAVTMPLKVEEKPDGSLIDSVRTMFTQ